MNIRFAGFGGQGIVVAGYVVGHAAVLDGRNALQTQSYGSESRGGTCKSDVAISDDAILDLTPSASDVLVAMSQPAYEKFEPELGEHGKLLFDTDLVKPKPPRGSIGLFGIPSTRLAEELGHRIMANVVMLGFFTAVTQEVSKDAMGKAVADSVPGGLLDLNLKAFEKGHSYKGEHKE